MKKFLLLTTFFSFSLFSFGQTCTPISTLDCSEVAVSLPVDLNFNSGSPNTILDQNNLGTGFTAVLEHSEARFTHATRVDDLPVSNASVNGYEPSLLTLNGSALEIQSQAGIAYLNPNLTGGSSNNNNQVNTLGVGFDNLSEAITIKTTLLNLVTGGSSAQAGIWFGFDEDNFVKLNINNDNIELRVESAGVSTNGDRIQQDVGASGNDVVLEMSVDPTALTVEAFYTIGTGTRTSLGSLPIPANYITGRDINALGAQDNVSFAGIFATHRNGSQFTAAFDDFSVGAAPFEAHVNFQDEATVPPSGYLADFGLGFPAVPQNGDYGWKKAEDLTSIDVNGTNDAGRNRISGTYDTASLAEKLQGTLIHFQGDNISNWAGQNRGNELIWELKVPNGTYDVTVGLGDKGGSIDSRHSATIEGYTIIPAFVPSSEQIVIETMTVEVTDGALTMNGLGGFNSKITHIDVIVSNGIPVNGTLAYTPNTASEELEAGATGSFSSTLSGDGATGIALNIDDDPINKTADNFNDWLSLPATDVPGEFTFAIDASTLGVGDTRNNRIIATAKGYMPAVLEADLTVTDVLNTETDILSFAILGESGPAIIDTGAGTVSLEVENGTGLIDLLPTISLSDGATIAPLSGAAQSFDAGSVTYTVTAEDGSTTQDYEVTVTEALPPLSVETDVDTFTLAEQTGEATIDTDAGTIAIEVANGTDFTTLSPTITLSAGANIDPVEGLNSDLDDGAATYTVTAEDGTTTKVYNVTVTEAVAPFAAFINFQDEATTPPTGYSADFGLGFPANPTIGDYGWKKLEDGTSIDVNGTDSAGRNRLGGGYAGATDQEKLEGTLVHFQGDNIGSWSTQNRGNELYWELQIPNGIYEVTLGLGDKRTQSLDSRHTATIEGYTIIPAFRPTAGQVKEATMIVEVTDGALTMNGLGGFNSKITHIKVVESTGTQVNGVLAFDPAAPSVTLEAGTTGSFASTLSGGGATGIALIIDDDPINEDAGNSNSWLSLPATNVPGEFTFGIDASTLVAADTRNNRIIATAKGFTPAILDADLTVTEGAPNTFAFIENFEYTPGPLKIASGGAWDPEDTTNTSGIDKPDVSVVAEGLTSGTTNSLNITNVNTTIDYLTLVNNPVELEPNVPFYYGTYFRVSELGPDNGNRIRVAIRVDDDGGEAAAWVRQMISRVGNGGPIKARLGLAGSNDTPVGEVDINPDQLLQFVVKGVWDDTANTISYEYTIAPTLAEGDNTWVAATAPQTVTGTPILGRIFISSTSTANNGKIGPIRLSTDYTEVVTEEIIATLPPVVLAQPFDISEAAAIGDIVGTVVATDEDTDVADLTFSITGGNTNTAFAIDPATGEITTAALLDFAAIPQYTLTVEVSDGDNTSSADMTIDLIDVCNPFSILPCDQVVISSDINLIFDGLAGGIQDNGGLGIGFTMVDPYSRTRLSEDGTVSSPIIGYDPSKLNLVNDNLVLTASKGIAYVANNTQINTLGIGLADIATPLTIETKLLGINTGGSSAQAGIWFGIDDKSFVKLNFNNNGQIELRREINDISGNNLAAQLQISAGSSGDDVTLRMVIDPINNTITAFYAINDGAITQVISSGSESLALPPEYLNGESISPEIGATSFTGIYATYRNGASPGAIFDATFDNFSVAAAPAATLPPVVLAQPFDISEEAAIGDVVGTVVATDEDTDVADLTFSITGGNTNTAFAIDPATGEITTAALLDFAAIPQYTLTVEVSDGDNTASADMTIDLIDTCNPLSILPCDDVVVALPVNLDFSAPVANTISDSSAGGTGFTAVLEHSEARFTHDTRVDDLPVSNVSVNGYEPSLLTLNGSALEIQSQAGIAYLNPNLTEGSSNNNNQVNTLGVGFDNLSEAITIKTTLLNLVTGGSSAQAGIWFGFDEDNFVKLNINNDNIELRVESAGVSTNGDRIQQDVGASGNDVVLEMSVDPTALTVEAFYTIGTGARTSLGSLPIPTNYITGRDINAVGAQDNVSLAGIFATHRNGSQFTATFDAFSVEAAPSNTAPTITSAAAASVEENQTAAIDVETDDDNDAEGSGLSYAFSGGADVTLFGIDPATGVVTFLAEPDFEAPTDDGGDNVYNVQVTVTDLGGLTAVQDIAITVTDEDETPITNDFAFIEDFDNFSPPTGDLDAISNGDWVKQTGDGGKPGIPVLAEGLTPGTSYSLEINSPSATNAVHDFKKLIDAPVSLEANVPFYFGTYFKVAALGTNNGNRIRVAIRVDDSGGEAAAWVRQMISRVGNGGPIKARLGLAGSNDTPVGEVDINPDQLLQFVVKGVWDDTANTISYEYTIAPTLAEGDNTWVAATAPQTVTGTPILGRIFISSTSTANNGKIGPIRLSTEYTEVVTEEITEEASPCSPFSTLPCDQIVTSNTVDLSFDGTEGGLSDTGFTMVDPYSADREEDDGSPSNTDVPGYEPGNLALTNDNLVITANKGIAYQDNNGQINTLGVGLQDINSPITIETKLLGITTGGSSAQAGLWFGIDDENFVKLDVNNDNVELRREIAGASANGSGTPDQIQVNAGVSGQDVTLRLVVDPLAQTLTAFYAINDGAFIQVTKTGFDNLVLPATYLTGKEINAEVGNASFAGVYATYRNGDFPGAIFDATFDYFKVSEEASLSFDVAELNFSGETGEAISSQTVMVSASTGTPTITLGDDPDSLEWLIIPTNPVLGEDLVFGIVENLPAGEYSTTITAQEDGVDIYTNAELQINLVITEPVNDFAVNINFSDPGTPAPANYERDSGDILDDRGNGLIYGWLDAVAPTDTPADLTKNGRNRNKSVTVLENTLIHMQYGNVSTNASNGYLPDAKWEIEVPNGSYLVTVFVGDPNIDGDEEDTPRHRINAEGVNIIDDFVPTGAEGASTRFASGSATVEVADGRLTLDPLGGDGWNTKISSVQIIATTGGIQTPRVVGVSPTDGATGVAVNINVSANDLFLPNLDGLGNAGVDNTTITTNTVKLFKVQNGNQVLATVNGTGGGDAINLAPSAPLEANTQYRFEINGVLDVVGAPFEAFTSTFTTGSGNTGPITDLDNVSFTKADSPVASGAKYSTLTIGPDGKLYGLQITGDIDRWTIENDGTLSGKEDLDAWKGNYNNSRTSVGLAFDPDATAQNLIAYISHNSGGLNNAPAWDGKISQLTGVNLETESLIVTNLPRSTKDHLTNSITFKPGENDVLYFNQGSNSAAGAPDNSWGQRKERLLSAAALRLDLNKLPVNQWPLDAKTTMDPATINGVNINSPTLESPNGTVYSESGQNNIPDDGTYNPYYINAPLTLFGTGVRNAYDLAWHSNGQLYIPTNGTAGGSNAPASIDDTRRPDGTFYDHNAASGNYPIIQASNGNNTQKDWLFRLNPANPLGYYGHPNPLRGEFVLNRGDADVNNAVYNGVTADINYRGAAFDFELNKSPNGVIEYRSNAENGNLTGALLVVRYSGGSDIIALVPDGPNGDIDTFKEGIPGFTGFQDPLDLVEDVTTGNIYVSDYGRSEIILLRPSAQAAPEALIVLDIEEVVGDAITSNDFIQEILLSNLGNANLEGINANITGPDSDQFDFNGLVGSLNTQNSASFNVVFTPTSPGPKFAQLTISGTDVDDVIIPLQGLGKQGTGGSNEPSLQWILDTQLGSGVVDVGDTDPTTNIFDPASGLDYNSLLGDELDIQSFERAIDAPITLELLSVYGPTGSDPVVAFGWYETGNASATTELFTVDNTPESNGQRLNPPLTGQDQFDPGTQSFGFYSRWPAFQNRQLFSEDVLNTFTGAIPHHVRVYAMPGETDAYIIATEEHVSGFDYQDIVVIARNIRPAGENPVVACSPISTLDCDELEVELPFALNFNGSEGGLSNTGFTMVDNPSARIAADGPISNANVPGYEPGQLSISNGNLIINANNGIAYVTNAGSSDVNSQINTLGVGFDADSFGNFSVTTTIVNPYTDTDAPSDSEQAGIWFGLNEDNYVKLIANVSGQVELRSELNGISESADQVIAAVANLNSSTVQLRLFVDIENDLLVPFYSLNGGVEVALASLPLPSEYLAGNVAYDNQSFAGVFATKRRETTADVSYTFEDFAITPENIPVAIRINAGGTATYADAQGNDWELDGTFLTGNSEVSSKAFDVAGTDEDPLFLEYRFSNDDAGQPGTPFGYSIPVTGTGPYTVKLYLLEPYYGVAGGGPGGTGRRVFNVDIEEGQGALTNYDLNDVAAPGTLITETFSDITVTDGNLTIDFSATINNAIISAIEVIGSGSVSEPFFANVNPADNATDVRIEDFQINVEVVVPDDYEIDISTLAGNVNLFEVTAGGDVLLDSNSNDTGGGDAITLTPTLDLKEFTTYRFVLTSAIEANRRNDVADRIPFLPFESTFTTGELDDDNTPIRDLTGVEFTKISGNGILGPGVDNQRFSSLVIGPDDKLYASTIGNFSSDGEIFRWDMAADGTLSNLEVLTPALQGSPHPVTNDTGNDDRLIIGLAFDPASTAENLIAYVTHSKATVSGSSGPEWDGKLSKLTGPDLSTVEDVLIHLPRSVNDHLTNSIIFDDQGDLYINQGSNSAGGDPDSNWGNRPERLLAAAVLKLEFDKLPGTLPLSVFTTDDIAVINNAPSGSILMSNSTYNPYATNSPLTIFASGIRNGYDFVWHSNGWLYVPTNGTAGNNNTSPNSPSTAAYPLARRIDGRTSIPSVPALRGGETQKDWLFKTKGGSYHGHPNPYRGEFVLNHGGISYSGLPGQVEASYTDVGKYPDDLLPDPNYREPAFDFGKNKSPNGAIEYKSDAFGGKLQGLLMVVRFSGQDDLFVLDPKTNGDIAEAYSSIPGLSGFDDPLDVVEDPKTGNIYISEYDRDDNGTPRITLLRAAIPATTGPEIVAKPSELIFEATQNTQGNQTDTKIVEITNDGNEILNITGASVTGNFADQFEPVSPSGVISIAPGDSQEYSVVFAPDLNSNDLGYQDAILTIESDDPNNPSFEIGLHGLKKNGYFGGNEPALQDVVDALGIGIDVGWSGLTNPSGTNPGLVGDEVDTQLWIKAGNEPVTLIPVGRYSPQEELPFGWYTNIDGTITPNEIGIQKGLDDQANAQTLFPELESGDTTFDPQGAVFGIYVESNSFGRFNYTEDAINTGGVAHRTRVYPNKDRDGNLIENSFLVTFEDATNGDYQDYMYILSNVVPFEDGALVLDFNKESLDFIASLNQEDIPVQQISLSGTGGVVGSEVTLESTEEWVVLPESFELDSPFDIGIDNTALGNGSYTATVTASSPNYEDATFEVNLEVTNELVYTYQFNFQDFDDQEVSPEGYIDDIGTGYGVQSTILGDLTYGWVLPGTTTPVNAGENGRNRASGVQDGVLLQTFTIIGHPNPDDFPQYDWVVDVPNGTYSVNISVGERDFSNSNHVLDVNGTEVVNFNQDADTEGTIYFEDTKFVEVTDGTLRMSLGAGGNNAKPNYIRLAPLNTSLLPPTILATFDGNQSGTDTYRGSVDITLEATDNSGSGSIVRLEYNLDGTGIESYVNPLTVSEVGAHVLEVTAEDGNGNITVETINFTIETPTGALLAIENMTKVPGTDRGFPADDYYTFHRLGTPGQAKVHDANVMRLNNTGTGDLMVTAVNISDANDYSFELLDVSGAAATLPITIPTGSFADLDITFIGTTGNGNNGIFVENIEIVSNADNALENMAVLHGAYSPQPEGGDEINAQEVFDAFGFQSSMLSIVNDNGTISPPNNRPDRPSSNFPDPANVDAGHEGDLVLSPTFVQADPTKPVYGIQLSALHGGPGTANGKFQAVSGSGTEGGISFSHNGSYYQTLLPKNNAGEISNDQSSSISNPFRINVASYLTTGKTSTAGVPLLGVRVYKVIDHNGNIIPNEYIVLQDYIQDGCGAGSANCDWNDNTFYFINIRPEAVPTAQPAEAYFATVEEAFDLDMAQYFDKGYPGNVLEIAASVSGGQLPVWLNYDASTGTLSGTPPSDASGSVDVVFDAVDLNGLTASTTLTITFNQPPVAVDDEVSTTQNVAILLDQLLANDSEPNGQDITIVTVDTPLNGEAVLQADGVSILYTPDTDYFGPDSFTYTIEDETGLTASADVAISVNEENQAPTAIIVASIEDGPAALFVEFTGSGSTDENPGTLQYEWDFGDGLGSSNDADTSYTFTSSGVFTVSLKVTDSENLFNIATKTITVSSPPNTAPTAVASATPLNGSNSLQFSFDASGSSDTQSAITYLWNFGDGNTSTDETTNHTYASAGTYNVSLTVTDDGALDDTANIQVIAKDPITGDFALRINAGGPEIIHDGETFEADQFFVGGKTYANTNAQVPPLYQTERSASPPTFDYNIPLENGMYQVTLHFAEIFWGATGGGAGGNGKRIFDVTLEGDIVLDDYDINAEVGPQTIVARTFDVTIEDGFLNMTFDATGSDGVNQPKLSGIAIIGIDDPLAECELPEEWTSSDIGAVASAGETCYDDGRYEVSASGADIWGSADEFHYVYRELTGDGEIIAQVLSLEETNEWAKAGIMMRNDLDANSASALMIVAPDPNGVGGTGHSFQHRPTKGATMGTGNFTAPALVPGGLPHYLRLVRSGNTFTGYISETNGNWTQIGSTNITMNGTIFVGLATTSHEDGTLTNAVYENVSVTDDQVQNEAPTALADATPISGKAPLNVSFDGTGSDDDKGVVTYEWDFDDETTVVTGSEVDHIFTSEGIYEVSLTVEDAEGETDTDFITITVGPSNVGPTALAVATPMSGEVPLEVSFDGTGSDDTDGGIVSYTWDFDDGTPVVTGSEVDHIFATAGTFDVSLTVADEEGQTDTDIVTITVDEPVVNDFALRINAGGPQLIHNGETFVADQGFVGGKSYTNNSAVVPALYKTERSALPPNFGYDIPLNNGTYKVTLHFAEIFWGATGGKPGGSGVRVFDVVMEGTTVLNDYDIIADVGSQTVVTKTFDVIISDGVLNMALDAAGSDGENEPKLSAIEILGTGTSNTGPTALATATPLSGEAPLQVGFDANGSTDDKEVVSYAWDFKDGNTSSGVTATNTFNTPGIYDVSLTVSDEEGETDEFIVTITVDEPIVNDFALRINAGGPELTHNGETFVADQGFVGGKSYTNNSAQVANLYKTERSAEPPSFGYDIPLSNGDYQVILHFAEIYWGATGGGAGGAGKRIFDVSMEGVKLLEDYDINVDVGPQTAVTKTFNVTLTDGILNLAFDAEGSDGVDQPKLSAIEVLGVGVNKVDPVVNAGDDIDITLPENSVTSLGTGSDPDGGSVSYEWIQISGPNTAVLETNLTPQLTANNLEVGTYTFRLTVTDDENMTAFDDVVVNVFPGVQSADSVWLEAECASIGTGWNVVNDGSASGGQYLLPPPGFNSSPSTIGGSIITFDFSVAAGTYKVFGRVKTPSGTEDSFWVRVNGGEWVRWNSIPASNNFAWHRIHLNELLGQPRTFELVEGANKIEIGHRESGAGLDKLYITKTEQGPTGLGGVDVSCTQIDQLPLANAGPDIDVTLPTNGFGLTGSGNDPDGGLVTYQWSQVSGPDSALLMNTDGSELTAVVLVEGVYVLQLTVTDDEGNMTSDEVTVTASAIGNPDEIWLEAECADVGSNWTVVNSGSTSGGQYLLPPSGNNYNVAPTDVESWVSFGFSAKSGTYKLFARVDTPTGNNDSFWVRANGGPWVQWNFILGGGFNWRQLHNQANRAAFVTLDLVEGANTVEFAHREQGAGLDKIYLTKTGSAPIGLGGLSTNCGGSNKSSGGDIASNSANNTVDSELETAADKIPNTASLFPNPADSKTKVTLSNPEVDITVLYIHDVSGRLVRRYEGSELKTNAGEYEVKVSNLENGVYLIRMTANNGDVFDRKLIVKH